MTITVPYDVQAVRAQFPALKAGSAHFDAPGGPQVPQPVIDAIAEALSSPLSNRGRWTAGARNADTIVVEARRALADLLGADPGGIVFGRSATQVTFDLSRAIAKTWSPGDEVVVTRLDHECNVRPWIQAAARTGALVRWADFDPDSGELRPGDIARVLSPRTRLVAVTAASNVIGTRPDIPAIADLVHDAGALLFVDAAHLSAHCTVDLRVSGADFLGCSCYKFMGPHLGVVAGAPELLARLHPDKLESSVDDVPERFELGILPYEVLAGARATVDFLAGLGGSDVDDRRARLAVSYAAIEAHEDALRIRLERELAAIGGVTVHSRASRRTPTLLLTVDGHDPHDVHRHLAARGVDTGAGTFYAAEVSRALGLGALGGLRVGLAAYTDDDDVDRLVEGLAAVRSKIH